MEGWGPSHWEPQVIGGVYGCNFSDCELGSFEPLRAGDLNDRFSFSRPGVLMEYLTRKACITCIVYFHYWVFVFAFFRQTLVEPVLWFHMITVHQWQDFGGTCSTITYDYILYIVYQSYSCTDISSRYIQTQTFWSHGKNVRWLACFQNQRSGGSVTWCDVDGGSSWCRLNKFDLPSYHGSSGRNWRGMWSGRRICGFPILERSWHLDES